MNTTSSGNILTDLQNNTTRVQAEKSKERMGKSDLDQDAFLMLMINQLKMQDPLNPMDNKEFLSQQAQFTQISELQKLNKSISGFNQLMQGSSLTGKNVTLTDPNDPENTISGVVSEAKVSSNNATLVINGNEYPMDNVISVKNQ